MDFRKALAPVAVLVVLSMAATSVPLRAEEEEKKLGWDDVAEFSWVATSGNSETSTFGFKNTLLRTWEKAAFELHLYGIRAENTTATQQYAVGPDTDNYTVTRFTETQKTAENYYLNGKYGRTITKGFFWYASAGWYRNEFAGIKNRYLLSGGVGNLWVETEKNLWRTDYGVSYTDQEDVVPDPSVDSTFAGLRATSTYTHKFGTTTTYGNDTNLDQNLSDTKDFRANMVNWVAVSMSEKLALKVSLQWLYDGLPALETVDFYLPANQPPPPPAQPGPADGSVDIPLEKLDTVFTTSLVIDF